MFIEPFFCPYCGNKFEEGEHICKGCGTMDTEMREELLSAKEQKSKCEKCGAEIREKDNYCHSCGAEISG